MNEKSIKIIQVFRNKNTLLPDLDMEFVKDNLVNSRLIGYKRYKFVE